MYPMNDSRSRQETGNFNYSGTHGQESREAHHQAAGLADYHQRAGSQKVLAAPNNLYAEADMLPQQNTLYAPPEGQLHREGFGGVGIPGYQAAGKMRSRQGRGLSGGPSGRGGHNSRGGSISEGKSNRSGGVSNAKYSPNSGGVASPGSKRSGRSHNSRRSGMTRNPLHFEDKLLQHVGPGIDDKVSHLYRDYDSKGRVNQSFYQRAALAGIRNLETTSFRKDSPVRQTQGRFPEKYVNTMKMSRSGTNYSSRRPSGATGAGGTLQGGGESASLARRMLTSLEDPQPLRTKRTPGRLSEQDPDYEKPKKMSESEQQLILEAAFSAVCDNIMSS